MSIMEHQTVRERGSGAIPAETLEFIRKVRERVGTVVVGQDVVVERLLIALFTGGHLLAPGRAGSGQDVAGRDALQDDRPPLRPHPVHRRPAPLRHHRLGDPRPADQRLPHPQGPDLHQPAAGRRDQPGRPQGAERAAGGDAGAPRDDRQRDVQAAGAVPGDRHPEPDRAERDVRAARGPARPVHALPPPGLSPSRRGEGDPAAQRRAGHPPRGPRGRRPDRVRRAGGRPGRRHRGAGPGHGGRARRLRQRDLHRARRRDRHPDAEASPHRAGLQPARGDRAGQGLAGPRLDPRPRLRDPRRPLRAGRGRDPPPHPPDLRGPGRRPDRRRPAPRDPRALWRPRLPQRAARPERGPPP